MNKKSNHLQSLFTLLKRLISTRFLEKVGSRLFASTKYQVVVDLSNTFDLLTLFTGLFGLLIKFAHLLVFSLDALFEAFVLLLTPLDDLSHPLSF